MLFFFRHEYRHTSCLVGIKLYYVSRIAWEKLERSRDRGGMREKKLRESEESGERARGTGDRRRLATHVMDDKEGIRVGRDFSTVT